MKKLVPIFCSLLLSCTKPTPAPASPVETGAPATSPARDPGPSTATAQVDAGAPETEPDAGAPSADAGTSASAPTEAGVPGAATAHCSASTLSPEPKPALPPLPREVDAMRRRIIAAAVACDYEGLAALTREKGESFTASHGDVKDVAAYWRELETQNAEPVLARMVKLLNLPYAENDDLYIWPSAYGEHPKSQDWKALEEVYTPKELARMRKAKNGYVGLRLGIQPNGDWLFAVVGD